MQLKNKSILVTGGAGFIGSHLVDLLLSLGCYVKVIDNLSNGRIDNICANKKNRQFIFIKGDIRNEKTVKKAMKDTDIVFHLACLGVRHSIRFPLENHYVNAEGTLVLLKNAYAQKVKRFVYCSSSEVYGTAKSVPMNETHPTLPCTVYGASKLAGEAYARAYCLTYGLETVVVRPFNTYGPRSHHEGDAGEIIPKAIVRAMNKETIFIFGNGMQTRDFTYVEDTVSGMCMAAQCDKLAGLTLNLGSGFEVSVKELAERVSKMLGVVPAKIRYLKERPGDLERLYADYREFSKLTGWKPKISFSEGLQRTVDWFRTRPQTPAELLKEERGINWR